VALPLVAYFTFNSSMFARALVRAMNRGMPAAAVELGSLHWGPEPDRLSAMDVRLLGPDGETLVRADAVLARVDLAGALLGDEPTVQVEQVVVRGFLVELHWDELGKFNFGKAFPRSDDRPSKPVALSLHGIRLEDGRVRLRFPSWSLDAHGVFAGGFVDVLPSGLAIEASLDAGTGTAFGVAALDEHREALGAVLSGQTEEGHPRVPLDALSIEGFSWRGSGFSADGVELSRGGSTVRVTPQMGFEDAVTWLYDVDLRLADAHVLALSGGVARGDGALRARASGRNAELHIDAGPVTVEEVVLPGLRIAAPEASVTVRAVGRGHQVEVSARARDMRGDEGSLLQAPAVDASIAVDLPDVTVSDLDARAAEGRVRGSATFEPEIGWGSFALQSKISLQIHDLRGAALSGWLPPGVRGVAARLLRGTLSGVLALEGDLLGEAPLRIAGLDMAVREAARLLRVTLDDGADGPSDIVSVQGQRLVVREVDAP
jgi:hypothetical protein